MAKYDLRIILDTEKGEKHSYYSSASYAGLAQGGNFANTDITHSLSASQVYDRIINMRSCSYVNSPTTASLAAGSFSFHASTRFSSSKFLSASLKNPASGVNDTGSILFEESESAPSGPDYLKRYKFFGEKVSSVLGVPEGVWIYSDEFRLSNTGSRKNYLSGDVIAQSLVCTHNLGVANTGQVTTDIPFKVDGDSDRFLKFINTKDYDIPTVDFLIGYNNEIDRYVIDGKDTAGNRSLHITASMIQLHDDLHFKNTTGAGTIMFGTNKAEISSDSTGKTLTLKPLAGGDVIFDLSNGDDIRFRNPQSDYWLEFKGNESRIDLEGDLKFEGTGSISAIKHITGSGNIKMDGHVHAKTYQSIPVMAYKTSATNGEEYYFPIGPHYFQSTYGQAQIDPETPLVQTAMADLKITRMKIQLATLALNNIGGGFKIYCRKWGGSGDIDDNANWSTVGTAWTVASSNQAAYTRFYHAPTDWAIDAGEIWGMQFERNNGFAAGSTNVWFNGAITIEQDWNNQVSS
tara:strand:- start:971 stop:2524 length:1554 start_codon:yes stop_codon:yes gene_type:complete